VPGAQIMGINVAQEILMGLTASLAPGVRMEGTKSIVTLFLETADTFQAVITMPNVCSKENSAGSLISSSANVTRATVEMVFNASTKKETPAWTPEVRLK